MGAAAVLRHRVIPFLLVQDHGLVKTTKFADPKYVGDPINAVRILNEKEVDELAILDISATPGHRGPNFDLVRDVASECFMPLAYGGGVRSLADAERLFAIGIEKVVVKSAAMTDLNVVSVIADYAGSSSVSVSVDVKRTRLGRLQVYAPGTHRHGDSDWLGLLKAAIDAGAGEIILNAVDRDGTMSGMNTDLIRAAAAQVTVPLVAVGGVGSLDDIRSGIEAGADAIGAGAFFVYHGPRRAVLITYPRYEELVALLGAV